MLGDIYWDSLGLEGVASGVGQHALRLGEGLANLGIYPVIVDPKLVRPFSSLYRSKVVRSQFVGHSVSSMSVRGRGGILHAFSNFNLPLGSLRDIRRVLTVHDIIPLIVPSLVSRTLHWEMRSYLPFALKRADAVICISKWTETTLCDRYPFVRDRIFVIPNGFPKRVPAAALESGAGPPRLVSVARGESYKQLGFLLSILRSMPSSVSLTLVTDSVGAKRVGEQGADLVHGGRLVVKMGLDKLQLQALVGAADVLVHTSLFEGFCLPACEALALGVPVVYRRGSGIDEVVDEGLGVGLAPDASSEDWADGIDRAISLRREKGFLARLDNSFAKHPSWDEVARLTRQVYDMLRA